MSEILQAQVQYGDWSGTAKADDIDVNLDDIRKVLKKRGKLEDNDFLIAFRVFHGENLKEHKLTPFYLRGYVVEATNHAAAKAHVDGSNPIECREIQVQLSVEEFFAMFKRFSLAMQWQGLDVVGREISYPEPE